MKCKKCKEPIDLETVKVWFDDNGYGYSTKLTRCSHCGSIQIVKIYEDKGLDVNSDPRFYQY